MYTVAERTTMHKSSPVICHCCTDRPSGPYLQYTLFSRICQSRKPESRKLINVFRQHQENGRAIFTSSGFCDIP